MTKRTEVLRALGLEKAPQLVSVQGQVAPDVAASLARLSHESGMTQKEIVGLAVSDWVRRAERRLKSVEKQLPESE